MNDSQGEMVRVRDRRELPFFQVHLTAVRAIRETASGPRLVRAIGFYALLCQLANEQRHSGEHRVVSVSYETLTKRGQVSKSTIKALLDTLAARGRGPVRACQRPRARGGRERPSPPRARRRLDRGHSRDGRPSRATADWWAPVA